MKNNTWSTWISIAIMAVLVFILRVADGSMDGWISQIDALFLTVTTYTVNGVSAPAVPSIPMWPLLIVGALLAVAWNMRKSGGSDSGVGIRRHLPVECQLWAKDLDA